VDRLRPVGNSPPQPGGVCERMERVKKTNQLRGGHTIGITSRRFRR
jgi:hypothetical protein